MFDDACLHTQERVTDEFESLTQGLSRYSCRLALLEFMQYKLTDLTRDIILSPMRDSKVWNVLSR